jgi:hypothetical protein
MKLIETQLSFIKFLQVIEVKKFTKFISVDIHFTPLQNLVNFMLQIQNYLVFGLFPLSGILQNRKHDVSETGSVSVLR